MKICNCCKQSKPDSDFRVRQRSEDNKKKRLYSNCKQCEKHINQTTKQLRKTAPKPSGVCHCCGKITTQLYLDHDHKTLEFRGWLCNNCNIGISRLGDNLEGIILAKTYLEKLLCQSAPTKILPPVSRLKSVKVMMTNLLKKFVVKLKSVQKL